MQSISRHIGIKGIPDIRGPNLWVSSDYVFGNKNSPFNTVAVLLASPDKSATWQRDRHNVRLKLLGHKRRMSFKALGDKVRQQSFCSFLNAADGIHGAVISISIDKEMKEPLVFDDDQIKEIGRKWCVKKWKMKTLKQMVTVAHFIAFFVAGVTRENQDVIWISDQDSIFANDAYSNDTGCVFTKFLNAYSAHNYGQISIGTTAIAEADLLEEDLASIADIAAGGSVELLTEIKKHCGIIPSVAIEAPQLPARTEIFWNWYQNRNTALRKIGCVLEQRKGKLAAITWQ